ncbi:MAG TPA: hypothetical protein VF594_10555 [Rubricoccaceae bacterium]|jgi:hypothetical protein
MTPASAWILLLIGLAGCLPSSGRQSDTSIAPTDSASVALAETVPVDTLALGWEAAPRADDPMALPTTIAWTGEGADARIVVVDTKEGSIRLFTSSGRQARHISTGGGPESYPYLAGVRGDTAVVLERGLGRLAFVPLDSSGAVRHLPVPDSAAAVLVTDTDVFVRTGGGAEGNTPWLFRLDPRGRVASRHALRGAAWRATGLLKAWGPRVLALSGYRPVIDVWAPGSGPRLDTLALHGFSSPEFARSAQFMRGEVEQPPLLTSSAAALGDRLLVVNMRADHVRIDVYDPSGTLQRVLVSPRPWGRLPYIPIDLAVRRVEATVELAVLMQRPSGILQSADSRLVLYRWTETGE